MCLILLAWLLDIFRNWTDVDELPEEAIDRDTLLTNVMLYWLTGTAASSAPAPGLATTAATSSGRPVVSFSPRIRRCPGSSCSRV